MPPSRCKRAVILNFLGASWSNCCSWHGTWHFWVLSLLLVWWIFQLEMTEWHQKHCQNLLAFDTLVATSFQQMSTVIIHGYKKNGSSRPTLQLLAYFDQMMVANFSMFYSYTPGIYWPAKMSNMFYSLHFLGDTHAVDSVEHKTCKAGRHQVSHEFEHYMLSIWSHALKLKIKKVLSF